ncbi:MAG: TfoX/Sxy family protein [Rhodobacteraceae bacterium]|nr:TfoX/Sxy family protein [Paracoccaceae bacterium]
MSYPVSSIRNLGPATEREFARAGIHTAEELRSLGPDAAYKRLLASGVRPHFIGYYALVMGLQGRLWNDCKGKEKEELRIRFDAICAGSKDENAFERLLDEIGVRARDSGSTP